MMSRSAIISNGVVTNVVIAGNDWIPSDGVLVVASDVAGIGWGWNGSEFVEPAAVVSTATTAQLTAYADAKRQIVADAGLTINGVAVGTDTAGLALLNGAVALATQVPSQPFSWSSNGVAVSLTSAQVIAIGIAVGQFIQRTFIAEQTVIAAISAGTITTMAQVDAFAWPTS